MQQTYYAVFDIGGSAVKCAVMDETSHIYERDKLSTDVSNFDEFIAQFDDFIHSVADEYKLSGIAISTCGAADCQEGVIYGASAIDYIHGPNFKTWARERHGLACEIENDACCALLAEVWQGEAQAVQDCCSVVIGSGIGGALVRDRKIIHGKHLHAGEFGYMTMMQDGEIKTFSDLGSTKGLIKAAAKVLVKDPKELNGLTVFEAAQDPDHAERKALKEVIDTWYQHLALGIFNIQYAIDPEKIILGGAISERDELITELDKQIDKIMKALPHAQIRPVLSRCQLGNDANLVGSLYHFLKASA